MNTLQIAGAAVSIGGMILAMFIAPLVTEDADVGKRIMGVGLAAAVVGLLIFAAGRMTAAGGKK